MDMRGLAHFIQDIRNATGKKNEEEDRVNEELAKIRAKFVDAKHMSLYDRKKYVCKLMFITMLGYPVLFGHMEGLKLMAEATPSEKLIGYLSMTVLLNENSELLTLTTHTVYRDLMSNFDLNRGLALTAVAHTGGKDFAEVMHEGVQNIVMDDNIDLHIRKKGLLTLLRVYRKYPEMVDLQLVVPKATELITSPQAGMSMCAITFLNGCFSKENELLFSDVPAKLIEVLGNIIIEKQTKPGYVYYGVPAPWLQTKIIRFLQNFPFPTDEPLRIHILSILQKIIKATDKVLKDAQTQQKQKGTQNRVSAMNAILFEVVSLSIQWDVGSRILLDCISLISSFIVDKRESNMRYIGLTLLSRLSHVDIDDFDFQAHCRQHQSQIIVALHDADVSVRKKALGVLIAMCNPTNANEIIKELLSYLPIVNEPVFKTSLVLSVTLLTEKYCDDYNVYVDIMLAAIAQAGDVCPPEVAYRVAQIVVNDPAVQKRAANNVFNALRTTKIVHQLMAQITAFILGEFGYQIALSAESTPSSQFTILSDQLEYGTPQTQSIILNAFFKFYNTFDNATIREKIVKTFHTYSNSANPELQQRSFEYLALIENGDAVLLDKLLQPIPRFNDTINAALVCVQQLTDDRDIWADKVVENALVPDSTMMSARRKKGPEKSTTVRLNVKAPTQDVKDEEMEALFHVSVPDNAEHLREVYAAYRDKFTALLNTNEGTLFQNEYIKLVCTQAYHNTDGRLTITAHDLTGKGIHKVVLDVLCAEAGLLLQVRRKEEQDIKPGAFS
ncbi:AP-2 complex subunit alpha [Strigomonas culicis]|uniref:AP-2 complex subunit alpha n=1 Tax=Strigomonas culicis TaxID=28005 RepID=S9TQM9_9TRYP|nr:AP-2 complex subunit alpha [Strigomonas culicis]|eukprot:EPY18808.1 AP-2 complex subunit alpha [Strigomonas culicis]